MDLPLTDETNCVALRDAPSAKWLVYRKPRRIVAAHASTDVLPKLHQVEEAVREQGLHAAGFLSYEAAPGFDASLRVRVDAAPGKSFPLLWFGLYDGVEVQDSIPCPPSTPPSPDWTASISEQLYGRRLETIREHLRQGDSYQVNFTFRLRAALDHPPWAFFQAVGGPEPAPHAAYVNLEDWAICSFSPELFFSLEGRCIVSRPMKGTRARGMTVLEDRLLADELRSSAKDRAENVMIVDMVRNDLGRIAMPGSVRPVELFSVEKHATVWQMTSSVTAQTDRSLAEILEALFPPASVTGAPKTATMKLIADLETEPRRIYTGCIGHFGPGPSASFNVAIRTVLVDKRQGRAEYGVGGGIVWDSTPRGEYEECRTKARILEHRVLEFELLETMLWQPGQGFALLEEHLRRLAQSAEYFDIPMDIQDVRQALVSLAATLPAAERVVRLLLNRSGRVRLEDKSVPQPSGSVPRVTLAVTAVNSRNPMLYHKTTHRGLYEQALAGRPGFDDVLLHNERGEITESTRANVAARVDGVLCTPPVACGVLAGTMRRALLQRGAIIESVLRPADLREASEVVLFNSVRGMYAVEFVG